MAKSKEALFVNIDNLLADIQNDYLNLKNQKELCAVELTLLAGKANYLSSYFEALKAIKATEKVSSPVSELTTSNEEAFAPADVEWDNQKVFDEISEVAVFPNQEEQVPEVIASEDPIEAAEEVEEIQIETTAADEESTRVEEEILSQQEELVEPLEDDKIDTTVEEEIVVKEEDKKVESEVAPAAAPTRPLTLNELIQQQKQSGVNITQQFQTSTNKDRVADLKSAISLNDKLLFIKDLFKGYSLAYTEAVELVNRFDNFAEADAFLQSNYAVKNGWAEKPNTVEKFYAILRQKFNN